MYDRTNLCEISIIVLSEDSSAPHLPFFPESEQRNQILAHNLIIIHFGALQNLPLIYQTLAILASIQSPADDQDEEEVLF
jgi:hypothetical protein